MITFWNWFTEHNEQLTMLGDLSEEDRKRLLDEMQDKLTEYCEGLYYELGEPTTNGRKLTFTAEGDSELFRYVFDLVDNAPELDWWEFEAFKQPKGKALRVQFDQYHFDTAQMHFMQLECEEEPDIVGLRIALPPTLSKEGKRRSTESEDDLLVGVYVTIEALIGEFDCATLIGYIETCAAPKEPFKEGFRPLDDLPEFIEWFKAQRDKE